MSDQQREVVARALRQHRPTKRVVGSVTYLVVCTCGWLDATGRQDQPAHAADAALSALVPARPDLLRAGVEALAGEFERLAAAHSPADRVFLADVNLAHATRLRALLNETDEAAPWEHEGHKPVQHRDRKPPCGGGYDCTCRGNPRCEKEDA